MMPIERDPINRGFDRRIAATDDEKLSAEVVVRVLEIVGDMGEVFTGDPQPLRGVHGSDCQDHCISRVAMLPIERRSPEREAAVLALLESGLAA